MLREGGGSGEPLGRIGVRREKSGDNNEEKKRTRFARNKKTKHFLRPVKPEREHTSPQYNIICTCTIYTYTCIWYVFTDRAGYKVSKHTI